MSVNEIINLTNDLNEKEKYILIENLILNLNKIDKTIEKQWINESEKRLESYENGKLQTLSFKDVFK